MSDSDCPDCFRQFLSRSNTGSCPKCTKLNAIRDRDSAEYAEAEVCYYSTLKHGMSLNMIFFFTAASTMPYVWHCSPSWHGHSEGQ